jgi:hypothetical protein
MLASTRAVDFGRWSTNSTIGVETVEVLEKGHKKYLSALEDADQGMVVAAIINACGVPRGE